jgi:hypothetical protein
MNDYFLGVLNELWPQGNWSVFSLSGNNRELHITAICDGFGFECHVDDDGALTIRRLGLGDYFNAKLDDHESIVNAFRGTAHG